MALKWYRPESASASQLNRISRLLTFGSPGRAFLWPIDIARADNRPSFGYVMPVREARFESLSTVMDGRTRIPLEVGLPRRRQSLRRLSGPAHQRAVLRRHQLRQPVRRSGIRRHPGLRQRQRLRRRRAERRPRHALLHGARNRARRGGAEHHRRSARARRGAVLPVAAPPSALRCARARAARPDAGFAARAAWASTRCSSSIPTTRPTGRCRRQDNPITIWPALPGYVRALFTTAFTAGLRDPKAARVTESQWRSAMRRLEDLVRRCPVCRSQQFYDPADPLGDCAQPDCRAALAAAGPAGHAHDASSSKPARRFAGTTSRRSEAPRPTSVIGQVIRHPETGMLALRNASPRPWLLHRPDRPDAERRAGGGGHDSLRNEHFSRRSQGTTARLRALCWANSRLFCVPQQTLDAPGSRRGWHYDCSAPACVMRRAHAATRA